MKLTRLATWIPDLDQNALISKGANNNATILPYQNSYIIVKWNGCTASTQIGTLFVTITYSVQPIASMRAILPVTPRGGY